MKDLDLALMRLALSLARRGFGETSPNPMVGAVLVKQGRIIGRGWHRRAGQPHAEIEALVDARRQGFDPNGATLYVTLEPCSTAGRTPPCTSALIEAGLARIVVGATDPNPRHAGRAFDLLTRAGIRVAHGILAEEATRLNPAFNHWIISGRPFVTLKSAMTLDGKIATVAGASKWITSPPARKQAMRLRHEADAILVGARTVRLDNPGLTLRGRRTKKNLRRLVLDPRAEIPLESRLLNDRFRHRTIVVTSNKAPANRCEAIRRRGVRLWTAPAPAGQFDLSWLLAKLGAEQVTHLLVEGGGETHAAFLKQQLAQRVVFFYAPKIFGGAAAAKAVAGDKPVHWPDGIKLRGIRWRRIGPDLMLTGSFPGP